MLLEIINYFEISNWTQYSQFCNQLVYFIVLQFISLHQDCLAAPIAMVNFNLFLNSVSNLVFKILDLVRNKNLSCDLLL